MPCNAGSWSSRVWGFKAPRPLMRNATMCDRAQDLEAICPNLRIVVFDRRCFTLVCAEHTEPPAQRRANICCQMTPLALCYLASEDATGKEMHGTRSTRRGKGRRGTFEELRVTVFKEIWRNSKHKCDRKNLSVLSWIYAGKQKCNSDLYNNQASCQTGHNYNSAAKCMYAGNPFLHRHILNKREKIFIFPINNALLSIGDSCNSCHAIRIVFDSTENEY